MERDLTSGSVMKNILRFSLPFLLSYFLQTLYGLADLFIIGQFCPTESTTAVSIGSQVMHMLTVMIVGLAMGSTVLIGKAVGGKDEKQKNLAIGNTVTLFAIVAVVITAVLLCLIGPIVGVMSTPLEAVKGTSDYLRICFIGIPFIVAYNIISSVFRGTGDSKSPMYFIAVACAFNIGLDYFFIGYMGLGAAGAALGTTVAQAISVVVSVTYTLKKKLVSGIKGSDFKLDKTVTGEIFHVGLPVTAQDGFIQISFILITIFANKRGLTDAAAVGIVEKLISFLFLIPSSLLSSVSTLCAQNIGAGKHDRATKTLYYAMAISVGCGAFFAILFQFISPWAIGLFSKDADVIRMGTSYMRSYVVDCMFAGSHFVFSGYFCAYSKSGISFLHNIISIITARIPISYYASVHFPDTLTPMGMAAPIGSFISVIICVIAFAQLKKQQKSTGS